VTHYELIWIASPTLPPEEVERIGQGLENSAKELGATLLKVERWGKKKLAYRVRKNDEGYYTYYLIEGGHAVVDEMVRRIRMNDQIIKFLSVRVDLEALMRAANRRPPRETVAPDVGEMDDEAAQGGY
jgi:small subunit ribosomal protein S6